MGRQSGSWVGLGVRSGVNSPACHQCWNPCPVTPSKHLVKNHAKNLDLLLTPWTCCLLLVFFLWPYLANSILLLLKLIRKFSRIFPLFSLIFIFKFSQKSSVAMPIGAHWEVTPLWTHDCKTNIAFTRDSWETMVCFSFSRQCQGIYPENYPNTLSPPQNEPPLCICGPPKGSFRKGVL